VALSTEAFRPEATKKWEVADIFGEFGERYRSENPIGVNLRN
jgi:hypothetical protein